MTYTVGVKLTVKAEQGVHVTDPVYLNPLSMCDALKSVSTLTSELGLIRALGIIEDFSIVLNSGNARSPQEARP